MDMERRVRRFQEVSDVSAHPDGPAGPANWVSGNQQFIFKNSK